MIMNWIGHQKRKAWKSDSQRQKEYFARQRRSNVNLKSKKSEKTPGEDVAQLLRVSSYNNLNITATPTLVKVDFDKEVSSRHRLNQTATTNIEKRVIVKLPSTSSSTESDVTKFSNTIDQISEEEQEKSLLPNFHSNQGMSYANAETKSIRLLQRNMHNDRQCQATDDVHLSNHGNSCSDDGYSNWVATPMWLYQRNDVLEIENNQQNQYSSVIDKLNVRKSDNEEFSHDYFIEKLTDDDYILPHEMPQKKITTRCHSPQYQFDIPQASTKLNANSKINKFQFPSHYEPFQYFSSHDASTNNQNFFLNILNDDSFPVANIEEITSYTAMSKVTNYFADDEDAKDDSIYL